MPRQISRRKSVVKVTLFDTSEIKCNSYYLMEFSGAHFLPHSKLAYLALISSMPDTL